MPRDTWSSEPHVHAEPGKVVLVKERYGRDVAEWTPEFTRGYARMLLQMADNAEYLAEHPECCTLRRPQGGEAPE